jgi:TPR repeat protein
MLARARKNPSATRGRGRKFELRNAIATGRILGLRATRDTGKIPTKFESMDKSSLAIGAIVIAVAMSRGGSSAWAANAATDALARHDYAAAFELFASRAELGDPIAQNNLGVLYLRGLGTSRDFGSARHWFEQSAAQRLPGAMHNLGMMYLRGYGMSRDPATGLHWLEQAAEAGDREAQFFTGLIYYKGDGVPVDLVKAREWFTRSADQGLAPAVYNLAVMQLAGQGGREDRAQAVQYLERFRGQGDDITILLGRLYLADHAQDPGRAQEAQKALKPLAEAGNPAAQTALGLMYLLGQGIAADPDEGRFWLQQAARLGSAEAQLNLGNIYAGGVGVARDPVEAFAWYTLAAANGDALAGHQLEALQRDLEPAQRERATALVAELREKYRTAVAERALE